MLKLLHKSKKTDNKSRGMLLDFYCIHELLILR